MSSQKHPLDNAPNSNGQTTNDLSLKSANTETNVSGLSSVDSSTFKLPDSLATAINKHIQSSLSFAPNLKFADLFKPSAHVKKTVQSLDGLAQTISRDQEEIRDTATQIELTSDNVFEVLKATRTELNENGAKLILVSAKCESMVTRIELSERAIIDKLESMEESATTSGQQSQVDQRQVQQRGVADRASADNYYY